jgi:acetyl esterase/lipase
MAGDSSGGNAVAVINQRLVSEKSKIAKIQLLIYPNVQMITVMPSFAHYVHSGITGAFGIDHRAAFWYLGITNITEELVRACYANEHFALINDDPAFREKVISFLDTSKLPDNYKKGAPYYDRKIDYPAQLSASSILLKDKNLVEKFKLLFHPSISPLLADESVLKELPKTYFILVEWDIVKDEGLLYAERLKQAGVEVEVAFYERGFHGIVGIVDPIIGFEIARQIQNDLFRYLNLNL